MILEIFRMCFPILIQSYAYRSMYTFMYICIHKAVLDTNLDEARDDVSEFGPKHHKWCIHKHIRMKFEPGYCISRMISPPDGQLVTERGFFVPTKPYIKERMNTTATYFILCPLFRPKRI